MALKPASPFARYTKADKPAPHRIIAASFGEVGTLKTSFWAGAPGPIVFLSFDKGLEGVIEPFQDQKDIWVKEYTWGALTLGEPPTQDEAIELRDEFVNDFQHAITHARTVVIDKETELWDVVKYAAFGPPKEGTPKDWDVPKGLMRKLLNAPKALDINFGVIQGMKNEWVSQVNPRTGKKGITQSGLRVRNGSDDVEAIMHINIEHVREDDEFRMKIGKSRGPGGIDVQYQTMPACTFTEFAMLVFPGTDESDWS